MTDLAAPSTEGRKWSILVGTEKRNSWRTLKAELQKDFHLGPANVISYDFMFKNL